MNRVMPIVTVALLAMSVPAGAESYRLAFSRAENVEIFVEHASGTQWCSPRLEVRAVYGGAPDQEALARLFPKLGALLDAQCPAATMIEWVSTTADGRTVAQGTSAKAELWALRTLPAVVAGSGAGSTPAAETVASAPVMPAQETPVVARAVEPIASPPAPVAATPTEPAAPAAAPPEPGPVAPASPVPPAPAPPASAPVAPAVQAQAQAPEVPAASVAVAEAPRPAEAPVPDFAINGWKPADEAAARQAAGFLVELEDQNGCRMVTRFDRPLDLQYLSLRSDGLKCDADGYLSGRGRVALERSDGAIVARTGHLWFAGGLAFNQEVERARIAASDAQRNLWLYLGSDVDTRTHFLLRARPSSQGALGIWMLDPQVDAVTEQDARFREAQPIREAILAALAALETGAMPGAANVRIVFASDFQRGTVAGDQNHLAYMINAARRVDRRTRQGIGEWQFNLQQGANYVFQRDARLAQQRRAEEAREAQRVRMEQQREAQRRQREIAQQIHQEQRGLQTYRQFVDEADRDPDRLLGRIESDIGYEPFSGGGYAQLVGGGQSKISRIVRVDGRDGDDAKVVWPYEMRLVGQRELASGWYRVQGTVTLDPKRRDGDDLPLTRVEVADGGVQQCTQAGCADLATPLSLTRMTLGLPDWTPEAAEARIQELQRQ